MEEKSSDKRETYRLPLSERFRRLSGEDLRELSLMLEVTDVGEDYPEIMEAIEIALRDRGEQEEEPE